MLTVTFISKERWTVWWSSFIRPAEEDEGVELQPRVEMGKGSDLEDSMRVYIMDNGGCSDCDTNPTGPRKRRRPTCV